MTGFGTQQNLKELRTKDKLNVAQMIMFDRAENNMEKGKLLVTSIFSFSHVFNSILFEGS